MLSVVHAHLLGVLLLDRFEISSQIQGDLVFGAQQGAQDGVGRNPHPSQVRPLKLAPQV